MQICQILTEFHGMYIMYPNCRPNIMILAQAVLQIFCSQGCFTTQNDKVEKEK